MRMRFVLCAILLTATAVRADDPPKPPPDPPTYGETVEVTASRTEQPVLDAPAAMTVVGTQQIETSAADNYADLLRGVPGLNVVQTSARDMSFRARGATKVAENSQLVMLDGRSVYNDYYGIVVWDYLPVSIDELKSVEVIRGPASAVWGANAMSGVINLRTKTPRELEGGLVTASIGEQDTRSIGARYAQGFDRWSYKFSASLYEQDPWERDNRLPDGTPFPFGYTYENHGTRQPKLDGRVDFDLDSASILSLRGGYGGTTGIFHSPIGPFLIEPGAHVDYLSADYSRGSLEAKVYGNHLNGDAPSLLNGLPFAFETYTWVADVTNRAVIGSKQALVYGVSARDNEFDLSIAPLGSSRQDAGVFVEDIIEVSRAIEANVGVRVDWFDTIGTVASPRLSLILKPAANQAIRLSANRAYRAPTLLENYVSTAVPNLIFLGAAPFFFFSSVQGNLDLKQESADTFEVGYSIQHGPVFVTSSVYRNVVHDNSVFLPTEWYGPSDPPAGWPGAAATVPLFTMPKVFSYLNVGRVSNQGFDVAVETRLRGNVSARAAYAYQDEPRVSGDSATVPLFVNIPPKHSASVSGEKRADRWFASAAVAYTDKAFWSDVLDPRFWGWTDAWTTVNAAYGYDVTHALQVIASGTNLLDTKIKQHVFGDIIGRKLSLEARYRF
jgi:outer membrane receptor protein involved in Fe transport